MNRDSKDVKDGLRAQGCVRECEIEVVDDAIDHGGVGDKGDDLFIFGPAAFPLPRPPVSSPLFE